MKIKTVIGGSFERDHASVSDAKHYISSYSCYVMGTDFAIIKDGEEIGFGVFINQFFLEDGDEIYLPEWLEEPEDDRYFVGYYDENGEWYRSSATFATYDEAQAYCDDCNYGEPAHYICVEK